MRLLKDTLSLKLIAIIQKRHTINISSVILGDLQIFVTKTINLHDDNYDDNIEVYFMINIERMEKHLLKIFQLTFTLFFLIF